ncbi:condensation domain-containing protein [Saccharothrix sp. BKS2]|uniref:condensation domain-containing protein n=1 Tax=Saccharothrix sp. BKS2 TaxID=3064400 RepID=UPI0039EC3E41
MSSTYEVTDQGAEESPGPVIAPLSYTQQQLWFTEQIDPGQSLYTEALAVRVRGALDVDAVERAVREVLRRHESLRTVFPVVGDQPVQRVLPPGTPMSFLHRSVADVPDTDREEALAELVREFIEEPRDLTAQLPTRALLVSVSPEDRVLVVTLHHLVCDGLSGRIVFAELGRLYEAFAAGEASPLEEPRLQYADFTDWERALLDSGYLDDDVDHWRDRLAGVEPVLELPARRPRPAIKGVRGTRARFPLADAGLRTRITAFRREHNVSLYTLTLAAFAATVSRYTGQHDLVFGTLAANRARSELEGVVGQFTNTLPMRLDVTGDPTLLDLVGRAARTSEDAVEHGLVSLGKIIELIGPRRDPSRNALVQHLFLTSGQPASDATWGSAAVTPFDVPRRRGRLDTITEVEERGAELVSWVEYDTDLFDHDEVAQLMRHFANALAEWVGDPGLRVSELALLDRAEVEAHLAPARSADLDAPAAPPAGATGTAITTPDGAWTFEELAAPVADTAAPVVLDDTDNTGTGTGTAAARVPATTARVVLDDADADTDAGTAAARVPATATRVVLTDTDTHAAGPAIAGVLAAATQDADVVLCACGRGASDCACPALSAREVVRMARGLAGAIWPEAARPVVLADDVPARERFAVQLAAVLRGVPSEVVHGPLVARLREAVTAVVGATRVADLLDAVPAAPHVVVGDPDQALVARLDDAGHVLRGLVGHPGVLGPVALVRRGRGGEALGAPLPHVDALVLDGHSRIPPVGVPGRLHLRTAPLLDPAAGVDTAANPYGAPGEVLVRTGLVARRTATGAVEVVVAVGDDTGVAPTAGTDVDSPLRELLAGVWREVLEVDSVAPDDDFFELGGHSMLAARMIEHVRETIQVEVPLRTLFAHSRFDEFTEALRTSFPEVDDLLSVVSGLSEQDAARLLESIPAEHAAGSGADGGVGAPRRFPLSSPQLQMWLVEYLRDERLTYTIPLEFRITGPLDVDVLRRSVQRVVDRHDALRVTVEQDDDGEPVQVVHDSVVLDIPCTDLTGREDPEAVDEIRGRIGYHEFVLAEGPLLAAHVVRHAPDEHTLYVVFHHLVVDERSMTLFMAELSALYSAEVEGTPGPADLRAQIGDYVAWERAQLSGDSLDRLRSFWRSRLHGVPELDLPTDHPRPKNLTFDGEFLYRPQERGLFDEFAALASAHHVTPFIAFTAATSLLLHRISGQDLFLIGMPSDTRGMSGSEQLIGCFINVLPVRVDCTGSPTFAELLRRLREEVVAGYDHRALPLSAIVDAVGGARPVDRLPLFQVTTELQVEGWLPFRLPGCDIDYSFIGHGTARYDMAFHAIVKPASFEVCAEVNSGIHTFATGYRRLDQLSSLIRQVVRDPGRPLADYTVD